MTVATIHLAGEPRVFVADHVRVAGGVIEARGRWRRRTGPSHAPTFDWSARRSYTWPVRRLHEVRWAEPEAEAAA